MVFLTPRDARRIALGYFKVNDSNLTDKAAETRFRKLLGSSSLDIANIWYDMCQRDDILSDLPLSLREKTLFGFKKYIMAHYWLWTYQRSSDMYATVFQVCERNCRGEPIMKWIKRIAALKALKIKMNIHEMANPDGPDFVLTVDGVDFRKAERKHPTLPQDNKDCSHKFRHAAFRYEVAIDIWESKIRWISGPHRGGKPDKSIASEKGGLLERVPQGKLVIADGGYNVEDSKLKEKLALPRPTDSKQVNNFKSRARLRHETLNSRLKNFEALFAHSFRQGEIAHKHVFEAVCVIVQYQMDNGAELFAV